MNMFIRFFSCVCYTTRSKTPNDYCECRLVFRMDYENECAKIIMSYWYGVSLPLLKFLTLISLSPSPSILWTPSTSGKFSTKSAHHLIQSLKHSIPPSPLSSHSWKALWKLNLNDRLKTFYLENSLEYCSHQEPYFPLYFLCIHWPKLSSLFLKYWFSPCPSSLFFLSLC